MPTTTEVARLLRARTKDKNGIEVGDWSVDTRPTPTQVQDLLDMAYGDVVAQAGTADVLSGTNEQAARTMVALRAAMFVELSYFPEQVRSDRSAYPEYKRLYDDGMRALLDAI